MSTVPPAELLKSWTLENMTSEMTIGHMLQNLVKLHRDFEADHLTLYNLRADIDRLIAHTGLPSSPKGKQQPPKAS